MSIPLDTGLVTELGKPNFYPGLYVQIEGVPYLFGTASSGSSSFPLTYGAGKTYGPQPLGGSDAGRTYKYGDSVAVSLLGVKRLKQPTGFEAMAMPEQGDTSFGGASITIQDCPELRDTIANYSPLKGKRTTVFAGAAPVAASKWCQVYTGTINRRDQLDDRLGWTLEAIDVTRETKDDIFALLQTELTAPLSAVEAGTMAVLDSSAFPSASGLYSAANAAIWSMVRIGDEVIFYSSRANNSSFGPALIRARCGTVAAAHSTGDKVTEFLFFVGHPLDVARWILLSTGTGTNTPGGTNYDVLPERHGLGIPYALIDINSSRGTSFESAKTTLSTSDRFEFWITEKENARRFLSEQIYKTCNILPIVYGDGRQGVAVFSPPEPDAGLFVFDPSKILMGSAKLTNNDDRIYNECRWRYDYNAVTGKFKSLKNYSDDASISKYRRTYPMPFDAKGVRSFLYSNLTSGDGENIAISRSQRFLTRFADPPTEIECLGTMATLGVEVGDLVTFSSRELLDPRTGERGVGPITVQVTGKSMDFAQGAMKFRLQYAFANFRYGRIPFYGTPNYSSATNAQRDRFVFAADPLLQDVYPVDGTGDEPYRLG